MKRYLRFIALFMIEIIICMPIYISAANAQESPDDLFINVTLPDMHNKIRLNIEGVTKPYADLTLYINDEVARKYASSTTGASGVFRFNDVLLSDMTTNNIRISAEDADGNLEEVMHEIYVDATVPKVTLSDLPSFSKDNTLKLEGSTDELVHMDFYVTPQNAGYAKVPSMVQSLHVDYESLRPNSVTIAWIDNDESEEVEEYLIYRSDVGLIATVEGTPFTDLLASTNKTYTYHVTAINGHCNEGPKTSIIATTFEGGQLIEVLPDEETYECQGEQPQISIDIPPVTFIQTIELYDGMNIILINATDKTGNSIIFEGKTFVDTSPPEILETNIESLNPTYVRDVSIKGKVSENATVHIYLNDASSPEASVRTDPNGNFELDITLDRSISFDTQEETGTLKTEGDTGNQWINYLNITAIDDSGLQSSLQDEIIYSLCGQGADWDIDIGQITPDVLLPRMLLEGIAQVGFDAKFIWQGPGDEGSITSITLERMPLSAEQADENDLQWIKSMPDPVHDSDFQNAYFLINLKSPWTFSDDNTTVEQENNISDHRIGECAVPQMGCVKLPLIMVIDYTYYDPYNKSSVSRVQKQCIDTKVMIDRRFPPDNIPEDFLNASVETLTEAIELIDKILEPVKTARKWVFLACGASWVIWWLKRAGEWSSCIKINPDTCDENAGDDDADTCAACLVAKSSTISFWTKSQWLCDRIMCPAAPTIDKYVLDARAGAKEGSKEGLARSHCAAQEVGDIKYNALDVDGGESKYDDFKDPDKMNLYVRTGLEGAAEAGKPNPDYCEYEYYMNYNTVAVFMNELEESLCVRNPDAAALADENAVGIDCGGAGKLLRVIGGICSKQTSNNMTIVENYNNVAYYYFIETGSDNSMVASRAIRERKVIQETVNGRRVDRDAIIYTAMKPPIFTSEQCKDGDGSPISYANITKTKKYNPASDKQWKENSEDAKKQESVPESVYMNICQPPKEYAVDPTSGLVVSFRAVCLTAMAEYLQHWRTILSMVRNCLQTILYTGDGSAGICKQVLTIYLCDLIYFAITCIQEQATAGYGAEKKVQGGFSGFLSYMQDSSAQVQQGVTQRYGSSSVYKSLFVERKLIHAVCAFAFTGDWDLDLDEFLESEVDIPIETTCVATGTRRFLTKDPSQGGKAKFMYHVGGFIVSGADDLRYNIELVCSGSTACGSDIDSSGQCDCLKNGKGEQTRHVNLGPGHLEQGEVVDEEDFIQAVDPYRYDSIRILISYTDAHGNKHVNEECSSTRIMQVGTPPPADCSFDLADLSYHCEFEWGERGDAYFRSVEFRDNKGTFYDGDKLHIDGEIVKQSRSSEMNDRMALMYKIYRKGSANTVYKKSYISFTHSNPTIMDLFTSPLQISSSSSNKVEDATSFKFNPFVDITQQTDTKIQGVVDPFMQPIIQPEFLLDDVKGGPIEITISKNGESVSVSGCVTASGDFSKGTMKCDVLGTTKQYQIILNLKEGKKATDIGQDTTIKIFPPQTQTSSAPSERAEMVLELSLHYIDPDTGVINPSPISSSGITQEKTLEFAAINSNAPVAGREGRCDTTGYNANTQQCYCNPEAPVGDFDCASATDKNQYCYNSLKGWVCTEHPKCGLGVITTKCDCNEDGKYEAAADCDGTADKKYCYEIDAGAPKCYADPMNFPPQWQSTQFYADKDGKQELIGKLTPGSTVYVAVTYMDSDGISSVKWSTDANIDKKFEKFDEDTANHIYRYIDQQGIRVTAQGGNLKVIAFDNNNLKGENLISYETTA